MQDIFNFLAANSSWIQIFSLATGIIYMVMQVFQHKWMWYFGLFTAGAALLVSLFNRDDAGLWAPLWAQVAINAYFFTMDVVGIFSWKRIENGSDGALHLVKLSRKAMTMFLSTALLAGPVLCFLLSLTNDPQPVADGISMTLSIIAQIMLTRSNLEQWYMWMAADSVAIIVYASQKDWWMVALYYCYLVNCVIGINHWRNKGTWVEKK